MTSGGNMPRVKGATGEREIVKLFAVTMELAENELGWAPDDMRRKSLLVKRASGSATSGVHASGHDLVGIPLLCVEIKRAEVLDLKNWREQTERQARAAGGLMPVLIYRQNRKPWRVQTYSMLRERAATPSYPDMSKWVDQWIWSDISLDDFLHWYGELYQKILYQT